MLTIEQLRAADRDASEENASLREEMARVFGDDAPEVEEYLTREYGPGAPFIAGGIFLAYRAAELVTA